MQYNDLVVKATGGPTYDDGLSNYYGRLWNENMNDAEYRWLIFQGATPGELNDMRFEFLRSLGFSGTYLDMRWAFWTMEAAGILLRHNDIFVTHDGEVVWHYP